MRNTLGVNNIQSSVITVLGTAPAFFGLSVSERIQSPNFIASSLELCSSIDFHESPRMTIDSFLKNAKTIKHKKVHKYAISLLFDTNQCGC
jgi:hypothetical protein